MSHHSVLDVLDRLSREQPEVPAELLSPTGPMAQRIYARVTADPPRMRSTFRVSLGLAMAFVLLAGAAVFSAVTTSPPAQDAPPAPRLVLAASDMQRIVARTDQATAATGRATITFVLDEGTISEQAGSSQVTFAGSDLDMIIDFEGRNGRPGFQAVNRSIDGRFYLLDVSPGSSGSTAGSPASRRWYLDEAGGVGRDPFTVDPRTFVGLLEGGAMLEKVGRAEVDGIDTEHIRAVELHGLEEIDLGLGPIQTGRIATLDVWVDDKDIVRQMALEISWQEEISYEALRTKVKHPDGRITVETPGAGTAGPYATPGTRQRTARYKVKFYDLGAPIEIPRPADAMVIEGKG